MRTRRTPPTATPAQVVADLIRAENEQDRALADRHLAAGFSGITRSAGFEESRPQILQTIAAPKNPDLVRTLTVDHVWSDEDAGLAVVRSLVTTERRSAPGVPDGAYRNVHVLVHEDGAWKCVHWQATRLLPQA
ncbi:MAG: nuclear transport factor 2 family protein [Gemmatimonadaceae bacterium]|nr:nuclear transport factor 2 family protein [Gemmatimonadaceae bacterium]